MPPPIPVLVSGYVSNAVVFYRKMKSEVGRGVGVLTRLECDLRTCCRYRALAQSRDTSTKGASSVFEIVRTKVFSASWPVALADVRYDGGSEEKSAPQIEEGRQGQ